MQTSRDLIKKKKSKQVQSRGCKALCCSCRLSVSSSSSSSSEEAESLTSSDRFQTISSIAHAMVQERLDQMIRERQEARSVRQQQQQTRRNEATTSSNTKFVVMVAMEKSSYDPREDFRESMEKMIVANRIHEAKNLRRLLNYYLTMNSEEFHGVILEVFHEVCTDLFLYGKRH